MRASGVNISRKTSRLRYWGSCEVVDSPHFTGRQRHNRSAPKTTNMFATPATMKPTNTINIERNEEASPMYVQQFTANWMRATDPYIAGVQRHHCSDVLHAAENMPDFDPGNVGKPKRLQHL